MMDDQNISNMAFQVPTASVVIQRLGMTIGDDPDFYAVVVQTLLYLGGRTVTENELSSIIPTLVWVYEKKRKTPEDQMMKLIRDRSIPLISAFTESEKIAERIRARILERYKDEP